MTATSAARAQRRHAARERRRQVAARVQRAHEHALARALLARAPSAVTPRPRTPGCAPSASASPSFSLTFLALALSRTPVSSTAAPAHSGHAEATSAAMLRAALASVRSPSTTKRAVHTGRPLRRFRRAAAQRRLPRRGTLCGSASTPSTSRP